MNTIAALIMGLAAAVLVTALLGFAVIPWLRKLHFGQTILDIGPKWHEKKQGTPTMGGIMFIISILVVTVISTVLYIFFGDKLINIYFADIPREAVFIFAGLGLAVANGFIGFIDDYQKVKHHRNTGLTAIQKFVLQLAAAVAFLCLLRAEGHLSPNLYIPFWNTHIVLPWVVYLIFAAFVIVGTVNAVNITDGLDGLSSSVTVPVAVFFTVLGVVWKGFPQLGIFGGAMVGGLLAFLLYNHYPAKVFMGDTGSLFLGGAVAGLAFAYDMPLVLLLVGIVYICETLSDILQVGYFKLTHGKRIFKMTPIHHHFELCGWKEEKIVFVFTAITLVMCVLAYLGVMNRY